MEIKHVIIGFCTPSACNVYCGNVRNVSQTMAIFHNISKEYFSKEETILVNFFLIHLGRQGISMCVRSSAGSYL